MKSIRNESKPIIVKYIDDYYSKYYYRYAYPSNIIISAGLHFQLTKRTGMTKNNLMKQAKEMVYGK